MKTCYTREQIETTVKKKVTNGLKIIVIKDTMLTLQELEIQKQKVE